ncbi:MAG: hypothetical protein R3C17_21230 [Planctomycetaceae bacterium]
MVTLVYYRASSTVSATFCNDEAFEGHERILNRYLKPDLLILDDMGMKATAEEER